MNIRSDDLPKVSSARNSFTFVEVARRIPAPMALIAFMGLLKLVAIFVYVPGGWSILEPGFQFDPYVQSLVEGRGFVSCDYGACDHSSRMPGLPYFFWATSAVTSSLRGAAVIKAILLTLLVIFACRGVEKSLVAPTRLHVAFYVAVAGFILLAPNLIKHAAVAHYEEGYLLEILAIAAVSALTLLSGDLERAGWNRYAAPIAAVSAAYLFKSSMIVVWAATTAIVVYVAFGAGRKRLGSALIVMALAAPASWLGHNYATGHRLSPMSSYDGENMFRGWNTHTLDIYPRCSLDMLFEPIRVCEGRAIDLPNEKGRSGFDSEWAWNDDYKKRAMDWIIEHPAAAVQAFGVKLYSVLLSPRLIPHTMTAGLEEKKRGALEEWIGSCWLAVGRALELFGLGASLYLLICGDAPARRVAIASLFLTVGYATPYVLGFGYERHFSLFVMLASICGLFLFSHLVRLRYSRGVALSRQVTAPGYV
jgi:hypothetical protein